MNYLSPDGEVISDLKYLTMSRMANPDLRWEKTESFNVGLDLGFFNNRLNLSADWYYKKTNDMIMNMALPGFSGFTEVATNIGRVDNTGFELSLNTPQYRQQCPRMEHQRHILIQQEQDPSYRLSDGERS